MGRWAITVSLNPFCDVRYVVGRWFGRRLDSNFKTDPGIDVFAFSVNKLFELVKYKWQFLFLTMRTEREILGCARFICLIKGRNLGSRRASL